MVWFRVDDDALEHRKWIEIPVRSRAKAKALWLAAGCWSAKQLTDGNVPNELPFLLEESKRTRNRLATVLEAAGLWHRNNAEGSEGWRIHDWEQYQPSRAKVLKERAKNRERVQRHREQPRSSNGVTTHVVSDYLIDPVPVPINTPPASNTFDTPPKLNARARESIDQLSAQVAGAYAKRYRAARGIEWHHAPHGQALIDVARAASLQDGEFEDVLNQTLDAFFADEYAASIAFAPNMLAKQFGRFYNPPTQRETRREGWLSEREIEHEYRKIREQRAEEVRRETWLLPPPTTTTPK